MEVSNRQLFVAVALCSDGWMPSLLLIVPLSPSLAVSSPIFGLGDAVFVRSGRPLVDPKTGGELLDVEERRPANASVL